MKVLSPVDKVEEVEKLISAGADELFCGLLTHEWHNKYIAGAINRRPGGGANFTTFDELESCINIAHAHNVPVFLTLNEHYYTNSQYPFIMDYVRKVSGMGVDGLMVADLALMLTLKEANITTRVVVSTGGNTFNSETAHFYQERGAHRIILPRHLTLSEIEDITGSVKDIEFEAFILNSRCPNVDGFCTFQHGLADKSFKPLYENACLLPYDISVVLDDPGANEQQLSWKRQHIWEMVHVDDYPCGACALYELSQLNITSVKIVGRGNPTTRKIADLVFIRSLLTFLEDKKPSREEFRQVTRKLYSETYDRPCRVYLCYYPEVLVHEKAVQ